MKRFALLLAVSLSVGCASSGYLPGAWDAPATADYSPSRSVIVATEPTVPPAEQAPPPPTGVAAPEEAEPEEESEFPRHSVGVALNYVTENRAEGGWAVGLEYAYRFNRTWAVGGFGEYLSGDFEVGVFGVLGYWFPWRSLGVVIGPGVEISEGQQERWLARAGLFYEIEAGDFFIAPSVYADFLDDGDVALMVGGTIGMFF